VLTLVSGDTGVELSYGLMVESPGDGTYEEMLRHDAELVAGSLAR
jgi:hypothetical protein